MEWNPEVFHCLHKTDPPRPDFNLEKGFPMMASRSKRKIRYLKILIWMSRRIEFCTKKYEV